MAASEIATEIKSSKSKQLSPASLAVEGIGLVLNNDWKEAEELFNMHKNEHPLMMAGSSFMLFVQALLSFEEEKLAEAMKVMQETEKICSTEISKKSLRKALSAEEVYQRQVIIADCYMYQAILKFINMDIGSMLKGGWLMRKSWKIYERLYSELPRRCPSLARRLSTDSSSSHDKDVVGSADDQSPGYNGISEVEIDVEQQVADDSDQPPVNDDEDVDVAEEAGSSGDGLNESAQELSVDAAERLFGAVCFGYGAFHLSLSLLPPKVLRLIRFLGFEGKRERGLRALEWSRHSADMKAPFATLALLWYHTIIRPFFSVDGDCITAGVDDASAILVQCQQEYPRSALYMFFHGRIRRLSAKLDEAMKSYTLALELSEKQREIKLICYYEMGWLHMMSLQWSDAYDCFLKLKEQSRWSKCFYSYVCGLFAGAKGDQQSCNQLISDTPGLLKHKNNQLEAFVSRRAKNMRKAPPTAELCVLYCLEVLYLWNAFSQCRKDDIAKMADECGKIKDKQVSHIKCLVEGALLKELGEKKLAIELLNEAMVLQAEVKDDAHIGAFAQLELASIYISTPETYEKGRKCLHKAKDDFGDFDFDHRLNMRVHATMKRLNEQGTPL